MSQVNISDETKYLSQMRKTFIDKSWFMKMMPADVTTVIDFGSADNSFINFLKENFGEYRYIGIDNNENFLQMSKVQGQECYRSLTELANSESLKGENVLLILNSVLHEVYSYTDPKEFWKEVKVLNPKYIAIRDMYASNYGEFGTPAYNDLREAAMKAGMENQWEEFKRIWGEPKDGHTAIHFMLKYFYTENWEREVRENYLPFTFVELHKVLRGIGFDLTYNEFYGLPYLRCKWTEDFQANDRATLKVFIETLTTHMKLFLVREK